MNAIQAGIFQLDPTILGQEELREKKIQSFVLSKIYSFLKSEDRKVAGAVCKDWQLILQPQIGCVRLLELMQAFQAQVGASSELAEMIGDLEAQLLRCDVGSSDKIFKDKWYLFAKKCSMGVCSVVGSAKLFETRHFSKLYYRIDLLEQIAGKNMLAYSQKRSSDATKQQLQNKLVDDLLAADHLLAAVDTFMGMEQPSKKLGKDLIRLCKANQEYDAAIRISKRTGDLQQVMNDIVHDLQKEGKHDLAMNLIQENDKKVNAARMMLVVCTRIVSYAHVIHRLSNKQAGAIIDRIEKVSFDCTKKEDGFRDSREDLMVFLVEELLKRDMSDKAIVVYRVLGMYDYLSNSKKETFNKIQQYCLKKEILFSDPGF